MKTSTKTGSYEKIVRVTGFGGLKVSRKLSKRSGLTFTVSCHEGCEKLKIYSPSPHDMGDDIHEIGGVVGTRKEWAKLFREVGIR